MPKLDAHQHFWNPQKLHYPWLSPDNARLYRAFTPADLAPQLVANDVAGTIVVQATHDEAETGWLLDLANETPFIKGVVGWLDVSAPDFADKIDIYRARGPLCGIRHQTHDEPDPRWLLRDDVLRGLRILAERDLPFDLLVRPIHLAHLPELFEAIPHGRWIIDHIAKPEIAAQNIVDWRDAMRRVAAYPNVVCKISGMITEAEHTAWTRTTFQPYFEAVLEMFGPTRLLFGSDWPVCLLAGSYTQVCDLVAELILRLSESEQHAIWSGTAQRTYNVRL